MKCVYNVVSILTILLGVICFLPAQAQQESAQIVEDPGVSAVTKSDDEWTEVAIVVHGITPNRVIPEHDPSYERFSENLKRTFYRLRLNHRFDFTFDENNVIYTFYGSKRAEQLSGSNPSNNLEHLQQIIGEFDAKRWDQTKDLPDSLLRQTAFKKVREVLLYGISDAFYYNSPKGGKAIRSVLLKQVYYGLQKCKVVTEEGIIPEPKKLSITIFAHSLGAIVMYDLLELISVEEIENLKEAVDDPEAQVILEGFYKLKQAGRVRIRKFFSMGTQIPVMYLKYDDTMDEMLEGRFRDVAHIFPEDDNLEDPRWINLWDKDDILGYPVEYLFNHRPETGSQIVKDVAVDAGDYLPHIAYWWSQDVAEAILIHFFELDEKDIKDVR